MSLFLQDRFLPENFSSHRQDQSYRQQLIKQIFFKEPLFPKKCILIDKSSTKYWAINQFGYQNRKYYVKIKICKQSYAISILVVQLENNGFKKITSKPLEILFMRNLYRKFPGIISSLSTFYVRNGCIYLKMFCFIQQSLSTNLRKIFDNQHKIFIKAIINFAQISKAFHEQRTQAFLEKQKKDQLQEYLFLNQLFMHKAQLFYLESSKYLNHENQEAKVIKNKYIPQNRFERQISLLFHSPSRQSKDNIAIIEKIRKNIQKYEGFIFVENDKENDRDISSRIYNYVEIVSFEKINKFVGSGGSSVVSLAKLTFNFISSQDSTAYEACKQNNKIVAVKTLKPEILKKVKVKLINEKRILERIKNSCNKFFLKYYATNVQAYENMLIMQFRSPQTLDDYVERNSATISLWSKLTILINIISGIKNLMDYQIVHLDVKPRNILVCDNLITKIIDFGEAYNKSVSQQGYVPGYTFPYVAPQVYKLCFLKQKQIQFPPMHYTEAQDVYAFGIIMSQIIFRNQIFYLSEEEYKKVYLKRLLSTRIFLCGQNLVDFGSNLIMSSLYHIIVKCLQQNPQKRPKFDWIKLTLKILLHSLES